MICPKITTTPLSKSQKEPWWFLWRYWNHGKYVYEIKIHIPRSFYYFLMWYLEWQNRKYWKRVKKISGPYFLSKEK